MVIKKWLFCPAKRLKTRRAGLLTNANEMDSNRTPGTNRTYFSRF